MRENHAPGETRWQPARPLLPSGSGRVAIIVDDVGYDTDEMKDFAALDYPLTFSILPGVPGSRELARECAASGFQVMLHLPMEPLNSRLNPGPGCIMVDMTDEQIAALVEEHVADVPQAVGVNNHMGSRATADARVMRAVLSVLRRRGLFFVDSLTTGSSVAPEVAAELGVPYAARSVFLDTSFSPEPADAAKFFDSAQERMRQLGGLAQRRGAAIGICHYHSQTARMLGYLLPELKRAGVEVVSVSQLVGSARPRPATTPRGPERPPRSYEPAEAR